MEALQYVIVGLAPGLFWLWFLRRKDDLEPEPKRCLLVVFALGAAGVWGIVALRPHYQALVPEQPGFWQNLVDSFLVTALPEEAFKLAALFFGAWLWSEFDEPLDGILYGVAAGLGFASLENVWYLFFTERLEVGLYRAFTSTLGHAAFTGAAGFCYGLAKCPTSRVRARLARPAPPLLLAGTIAAVILHGLYDLFLVGDGELALLSLLVVLPLALVLLGLKVRWSRAQSPRFHPRLAAAQRSSAARSGAPMRS